MKMRYIIIATILMQVCSLRAQEIWQLQPWAPDSNYVMGALPSGEPYWILKSTITDTTLIRNIVSDSIAAIDFPSDSTLVGDTPMLDLTMTGKTITGIPDTVTYIGTKYNLSLKENALTFTSPLSRSVNTISIPAATSSVSGHLTAADHTIFSAKVGGSGSNTQAAYWTGSPAILTGHSSLTYNGGQWNMIGRLDLRQTAGNKSVCIGASSGNVGISTGIDNFWLGDNAGRVNTSGYSNATMGTNSLYSNTTGYNNTAIGLNSMFYNTSGSDNLALGTNSLFLNTNGFYNTALAPTALFNNTTGYANIAVGYNSLLSNTTGISNVAAGWRSLYSNQTGSYNVGLGDFVLYNTTGSYNVGLGYYAGGQNTTASNRLYIENSNSETPLIGGDFSGNKVGINAAIGSIARTLHVGGELRVDDLITDNPTKLVGADGEGDFSGVTLGTGLSFSGTTLNASGTGDIEAVTVTAPILGGGTSGSVNIAIDTARADGSSKGAASFAAADFNSSAGNITIDYANGQEATSGVDGFLKSTDWTTFNNKFGALGAIGSTPNANAATISGATLNLEPASAFFGGVVTTGTQTFAGSKTFNYLGGSEGTNVTTGTSLIMGDVNGKLENLYGSTGTNDLPLYDGTKWLLTKLKTVNGTSLLGSGDITTSTYAYWRLSANGGTTFAVTDNTLVDFNNSTGISWTRDAFTGEMTATLADNSATNEIQNLSYTNATRALGISSGSGITLPLVSSTIPGLVSAYPNNTTSFLRGDGTWATPPTPAVTGTAPINVTAGNITLNHGTGLANSGGQLVTYNPSGSIYSGSDTTGETFDTSYEIVAMGTTAVSAGTDISYGTNNISITSSAAAGRYQISYNCCHDVQANSTVTYSIFIEASEMSPNPSKIEIETQNGVRNCVSKTFLTTLANGDTVDLRIKATGMITGNSYGNANLTIIKL